MKSNIYNISEKECSHCFYKNNMNHQCPCCSCKNGNEYQFEEIYYSYCENFLTRQAKRTFADRISERIKNNEV